MDQIIDELQEIHCDTCLHYGCPVAEGREGEHPEPGEPCGDYRCCIN